MAKHPKLVTIEVRVSEDVAAALDAIVEQIDWLHGRGDLLAELANAVESGWRRPGSWERPWLTSVFPFRYMPRGD